MVLFLEYFSFVGFYEDLNATYKYLSSKFDFLEAEMQHLNKINYIKIKSEDIENAKQIIINNDYEDIKLINLIQAQIHMQNN